MLLDTSGLICYHSTTEPRHLEAHTLLDAAPVLLTHGYVLAEFVALAHVRGLARRPALGFLRDLVGNSLVEVVWVTETLHDAAMRLLEARLDKTYSLCDAVSFVLMRQRSLYEALTTDHHFEQEGFRCLLG
jgi:predicted nucleic acid-binding protein